MWVLALIITGSLIRIAMAGATGLGTDESYTVANARHFAWSYVDYPPIHVWLVGAWSRLVGSEAPLVVRLPFIAFFAGSTWMIAASVVVDARSSLDTVAAPYGIPGAVWITAEEIDHRYQ